MSTEIRENFLVGYGNQSIYPGGLPVFDLENTSGQAPTVLVKPGQFVFYDPTTLTSIDVTSWSKSTNGRFVYGVGYDGLGYGYSTEIRKSFGDLFYGCNINSAHTDCASCGLPQIQNVYIKGCLERDMPVSFKITVFDHNTVNEYAYGSGPSWSTTVTIPSELCNACSEETDCSKLVSAIWQQIRPKDKRPSRLTNLKVGRFPETNLAKPPFTMVPLYNTSYLFELDGMDGNCSDCIGTSGLISITIDGEVLTFSPAISTTIESSVTPISTYHQLQLAVNQINKVLNGKGAAVLIKSTGCCEFAIEINTCYTVGDLITEAGPISPVESNPFSPEVMVNFSHLCGDDETTFEPTCGFRLITDPIEIDHNCYINLSIPKVLTRKVRFSTAHPYQDSFPFVVKEVQKNTIPRGLGITWALREYKSDNGGSGRGHDGWNNTYGSLGLPGKNDRINSGMVDPRKMYSSLVIDHAYINTPNHHIAYMNKLHGRTITLVPQEDNITRSELEAAWNNYITDDYCNPIPEIEFC